MKHKGPVYDKSFEFALMILELHHQLRKQKQYDLASRIFRSGISVGANVNKAGVAVSRTNFAHKISIALKEARESTFWFRHLCQSDTINTEVNKHPVKFKELLSILTSIVKTTMESIQK